jgi:membrane fusion protein, copper/silver efflux system
MTPISRAPFVAIAVVIVAALGATGGYLFGTRQAPSERGVQGAVTAAPAAAPAAPADVAGRKVLYWHDPMVPGQKFDKPGKSPFMDMDLVPVYAEGAEGGGITINARQQQSFGVRTAFVTEGTLDTGFSAVGAVGIDERALVAVQARSPGYVERLLVRAQYDNVAAGQPLAELYVPEWLAAQEELFALKASTQPGATELAESARQRLRLLGMPTTEIARIERDGKPSARVTVTAPQGGIVWEIGARDGMAVMPGTTLFKLAGIGSVWVTADVPEAQAALVRSGAPVEARAAAYPDRVFKGAVNALLPEVNDKTRTVRARIVLANPGGALKPGMYATVKFAGFSSPKVVVVPSEAVIRTGKRNVVIVDDGDGRFLPVEVELGRETADMTEIHSGLAAGKRIVVSSQFLVDSEASLKGALGRIAAPQAEGSK